jgi:multidrug transporter EmrE-like cation transporter
MNEERKPDRFMRLVFLTIVLTVYSQLVIKWRVSRAGAVPADLTQKIVFVAGLLCDPWVITGILATFFSGVFWMLAMTKVDLSYAYPFMGLVFVLVLILSSAFFHEAMTIPKVTGILLVTIGIVVAGRG